MQIYLNFQRVNATLKDSLARAVIISLFSWSRARDTDSDKNLFGWWGDSLNDFNLGSELWTLRRSKLIDDTLDEAKEYAESALKWLIDDNVCTSIDVQAYKDFDHLNLEIVLECPSGTKKMLFEYIES